MAKKAAEKSAKELSEMLLNPRKNGFFKVTDEKIEKADKFCEGYKAFLNSAKTERESVEYAVAAAEKHGFVPFDPKHKYAAGDKVYYNNRGKAICLAIMGKEGCKNGVRIAAAHIDNPRLDLKPIPLYESSEMAYLKTHYYGGIKKYQWTAIPLSLHGKIIRKEDGRVLKTLGELATESLYSLEHSQHITAETTAQIKSNAYSFGCCFAEVEVDIPMCKVKLLDIVNVHDVGTLINPALAEAQVHGGMSMAIGYGMSEQLLFDEKTGKPLNNNLLDYKLSTFMDHPHLEAQFVENPEPTSPFGTKALGEPPACSGAPAIRNAILNATGVAIDCTPITPHVLFAEFSKAGLIHDSWNEKEGN